MKQIPKQMTKKEINFFKIAKTMQEITDDLFKGDAWAANHFQTNMMNSKQLIFKDKKFYLFS